MRPSRPAPHGTAIVAVTGEMAPRGPEGRAIPLLVGMATVCWFFVAWLVATRPENGLTGIEAYYWDWSRHPALGYMTKPPMVAYLLAISTAVFGDGMAGVRFFPAVFGAGQIAVTYLLVRRMGGTQGAALLGAGCSLAMVMHTGHAWGVMKTDAGLLFFSLVAVYLLWGALTSGDGGWKWWLAAALAFGVAALTKYTALLLLPAFALAIVIGHRRVLRQAWPYVYLAVVALSFSGVLYWNWQHGMISFTHTAELSGYAGTDDGGVGDILVRLAIYGLFSLIGSIPASLLILWLFTTRAQARSLDAGSRLLLLCAAAPFLFYAAVAVDRPFHGSWVYFALVPLPALAALMWARAGSPTAGAVLTVIGCVVGAVLVPSAGAGSTDTAGYRLGEELQLLLTEADNDALFLGQYPAHAAWLSFYAPGQPQAYTFPWNHIPTDDDQYRLWLDPAAHAGRDAIVVFEMEAPPAVDAMDSVVANGWFQEAEFLAAFEARPGYPFTVFRARGFNPPGPAPGP